MKIRTATIEDTQAIIALWAEAKLLRPWNKHEQDIQHALATLTSTLLVGESKNSIIGTVMTGYDGHRGWIYYLAVTPNYQRNGYGKELVTAAEEWLKSQGSPKVHLLIRKDNRQVEVFYQGIGYETSDVVMMQKTFEKV